MILTNLHQLWDASLNPLSQIMKKLTRESFYMQKRHQIQDMKDLSDVLVLLTFFANELYQEIWMQTGNFKSPKFINVHQIYIQNIMRESLLGFQGVIRLVISEVMARRNRGRYLRSIQNFSRIKVLGV